MTRRSTLAARVAAVAALAVGLSSCGLSKGAYDIPLPGGADVGSDPYTLSANFSDVMDLVPQSSVKVDNVAVGRVSGITLNKGGRSARVRMTLNDDVKLPVGTTARLQQTSLLGEKYVALVRPGEQGPDRLGDQDVPPADSSDAVPASSEGGGYLHDGDVLALDQTSQAVGVEQVLGALSALLSGGGLGQFQEISRELQKVSTDRPEEIRAFLDQTQGFVAQLDQRRGSITRAIDGLAQLSKTLDDQRPQIADALDNLSPGLATLADQRTQLVTMLKALDRLSTVSVRTLNEAQDDIVADFKRLDPILTQLAKSGSDLPRALQILFTYPFPDSVLGAINGDYINVFASLALTTPGGPWQQPDSMWPAGTAAGQVSRQAQLAIPTPSESDSTAPPMILPSTDSAIPGSPSPTVPKGSGSPSGSATPSPSDSSSPSPSGPSSPQESGSSSPKPQSSASTKGDDQ
ncbi:hypothetical protein GCM10011519_08790 [Marmoricola endophyticus]|uniref:MCE family protein n=1 Tax=Marmoricola endophyticus TaxID=2040280 RepID=A0A917BDC3_9ACTN|nr:MCE family protein [Marmoricola endophyticus]GGF37479.1 hypothetical protein GCM10011519_08790 [Marmoricola endophyticus]